MKQWVPLYENSFEVASILKQFHASLKSSLSDKKPCIENGLSSYLLFSGYLLKNNIVNEQHLLKSLIEEIVNKTNSEVKSGLFLDGVSGIAYSISHINNLFGRNLVSSSFFKSMDSLCIHFFNKSIAERNFDFFYGYIGICQYLFNSPTLRLEEKQKLVRTINDELEKFYLNFDQRFYQINEVIFNDLFPERNFNETNTIYNLGMAHGIPSVISFLCDSYTLDKNNPQTQYLLNKALNYLVSNDKTNEFGLFYRSYNLDYSHVRLSWCYCDLGIALMYLKLYRTFNDANHLKEAKRLADNLIRINPSSLFFNDIYLCHGIAGFGHLFNRLYYYTDVEDYRREAKHWFDLLINFYSKDDKIDLLKQLDLSKHQGINFDLYNGVTGVGLALLGAVGKIHPEWDHSVFLI